MAYIKYLRSQQMSKSWWTQMETTCICSGGFLLSYQFIRNSVDHRVIAKPFQERIQLCSQYLRRDVYVDTLRLLERADWHYDEKSSGFAPSLLLSSSSRPADLSLLPRPETALTGRCTAAPHPEWDQLVHVEIKPTGSKLAQF